MHVRDGYKMTELGEIPVEWENDLLLNVAQIVSGGTPSTDIEEYWESGDIPWATPTDITSNGKYISKTSKHITTQGLSNSSASLLPAGTILMTSRATIGACSINTIPMTTNQGFKSLISGSKSYNEFLYYTILNRSNELKKLSSGSTFTEISKKSMENLIVAVPPLPEQQKIADILSTVDEHISETESLIEKTKVLKQGMMQHLLTKGIGHTEFKDSEIGRIPVEWEVSKLDKCCLKITDGSHFSPEASESEFYMASVKDMTDRGFIYSGCKLISEEVYNLLDRQGCTPQCGDVLIAKDGSTLRYVFVQSKKENVAVLSSIAILRPNTNVMYSYFMKYYLSWDFIKEKVRNEYTSGSALPRIILKNFRLITIILPPLLEQQKIASILTSIDDQIDTYQTKQTALTKLKSALMQQLLTGKTRVKI